MRIIIDYNPVVNRLKVSSYGLYQFGSSDFAMEYCDRVSRSGIVRLFKHFKVAFFDVMRTHLQGGKIYQSDFDLFPPIH